MLRTTLVCLALVTISSAAQAQYYGQPSIGQMQSSGYACGQNYDCMERSRDRLGTMSPYYDNNSYGSRNSDSYQPYPSVSPQIEPLGSYGIGSHHRGLYGDDD
jgi:hypothetical protein